MIKEIIGKIIEGCNIGEDDMYDVFIEIMSGNATDSQIGAFIAALSAKGETSAELAGAARAMRRKAIRINVASKYIVDTCGTGGDGSQTFNISTTAAFVVAGCGVTVAKHGNRAVSGRCGSADMLETLGVKLEVYPEIAEEAVSAIGIGFMYAPLYHSAMKHATKARQEVGVRSIFNMLGPLTNPASANCQVIGVYKPELTEMFARALLMLKTHRAFIVHGFDGLDEISVCAPTRVTEVKDDLIKTYNITPEHLIGRTYGINDIPGGDRHLNAEIARNILSGKKGGGRDVVVVNAAAALLSAGVSENFDGAIKRAEESIDSGAAMEKLAELVRFTNA